MCFCPVSRSPRKRTTLCPKMIILPLHVGVFPHTLRVVPYILRVFLYILGYSPLSLGHSLVYIGYSLACRGYAQSLLVCFVSPLTCIVQSPTCGGCPLICQSDICLNGVDVSLRASGIPLYVFVLRCQSTCPGRSLVSTITFCFAGGTRNLRGGLGLRCFDST